jgi:hypothetical protein
MKTLIWSAILFSVAAFFWLTFYGLAVPELPDL